jgi:GxxExxY protein
MTNDDLTGRIIGCAYKVHNTLGTGFLERVYENALKIELVKLGHNVKQQEPVAVWYEGIQVGDYYPDLWVDDLVIIEIKAVLNLAKEHEVKLVHYLTATGVNDGLLINFGASVQVKRKFRVYKSKTSLADALIAEITQRAEPTEQ